MLGVSSASERSGNGPARPSHAPTARGRTTPRLRVFSYNIGGMAMEAYDVFTEWLKTCPYDIVVIQELHWGMGRADGAWIVNDWAVFMTADDKAKYSGVGIFISPGLRRRADISHCAWVPGRLLHVRCECRELTLDVLGMYQWVQPSTSSAPETEKRLLLWDKLGRLLHGLPRRNLLVIGADLNSVVEPTPGYVGRGVLQQRDRGADRELAGLLRIHQLVPLNTWGRARPQAAHTFSNGSIRTQIDFLLTRKDSADAVARTSGPVDLDLVPWRLGPKHRPVAGTVPWRAGWALRSPSKPSPLSYSLQAMREAFRVNAPIIRQQLEPKIRQVMAQSQPQPNLPKLNQQLLLACSEVFPASARVAHTRPRQQRPDNEVQVAIRALWDSYRALRSRRGRATVANVWSVWRCYIALRRQHRLLRQASRRSRRQRLQHFIDLAQQAARRSDMGEVYRIIRILAPKKKRDLVAVRSPEGHLLDKQGQFRVIHEYFSQAYDRSDHYEAPKATSSLTIEPHEYCSALKALKRGKAVPATSVPAEVWQLCPVEASVFLQTALQVGFSCEGSFPKEVSDCSLALLPKPGRPGRQPGDLRPLGLQDPSAKVLAMVLRERIVEQAAPFLSTRPQFAYSTGRALDEAITRVASHCRRVRCMLKDGVVSVHAKRQGIKELGCLGGIMISLDLSRAFDTLPRWALQASLAHVGVDQELQAAVLKIHEQCEYHIMHGGCRGQVPMRKGVRQGCSLSPSLYTIFTIWIYDTLAQQTSQTWADRCVTLFADDSHLSWEVTSLRDIEFCCACLRKTFALFRSVGMRINPDKSKIILNLKGSTAKRWLQAHVHPTKHGPMLSVGTPAEPLLIPRVTSFVYFGIVASYQNFELQTARHRIHCAQANKQRLAKVLHSQTISLGYRVRLCVACVRSAMFYGVHATGLTDASLHRLEQADSRAMRAVAKSPSFLTRESTASLYQRLRQPTPVSALLQLVKGRIGKSTNADSLTFFREQEQWLQQRMQNPASASQRLLPVNPCRGHPCDVCGLYFPDRRIMLSHRRRMHPDRPKPQSHPSLPYSFHAKDGMPECRHCGQRFTRVEGLKKHLKGACSVLFAEVHTPADAGEDTGSAVQVPATRGEWLGPPPVLPQMSTPAEPTLSADVSARSCDMPIFQDETFRTQVAQNWKTVLREKHHLSRLREHCYLCGQWIHMRGPGLKQHMRTMHSTVYGLHLEEANSCSRLGLVAASPCHYCGQHLKVPRTHLQHCPVVFQVALAHLHIRAQDGRPDGPGCQSLSGTGGAGPSLWRGRRSIHDGTQAGSGTLERVGPLEGAGPPKRRKAAEGQVAEASGEGRQLERLEAPVGRGSGGGESRAGPGNTEVDPVHGEAQSSPRSGAGQTSLRNWIRVVARHAHQQPGALLSSQAARDRGRLDDQVHERHGHHVAPHHLGPQCDSGAQNEAGRLHAERREDREGQGGRVAQRWPHRSRSPVALLRLGSQAEAAVPHGAATGQDDGSAKESGPARAPHGSGGCDPELQECRGDPGGLHDRGHTVYAHCGPEIPAGEPVLPDPAAAVGKRGHQDPQPAHPPGTLGAAISRETGGGKLSRSQLLRLESQEESLSGNNPGDLGRSPVVAGERVPRLVLRSGLRLPQARLQNPRNYCYLNSTAQAFYWIGELTSSPDASYGLLKAGSSCPARCHTRMSAR